jgi:hypothetical protein
VWCDLGLIVNAIPRPKNKIPVVPVSRPTLFFSAHPNIFFNTIDRATLFSPGGCGLLVQRAKMASVIEPNCGALLNVGTLLKIAQQKTAKTMKKIFKIFFYFRPTYPNFSRYETGTTGFF